MSNQRGSFSGQIGFIMASAASAVGLGNIWRFPYLAAKDGGGVFILVYIILAITFGYTLMITEIGIGRKTKIGPYQAYKKISRKWGFLGIFACIIPAMILPYYADIGGWVFKYFQIFVTNNVSSAVSDTYFTDYISGYEPVAWLALYLLITAVIVGFGVEKGIEKFSKILMPALVVLIVIIAIYSLTLTHKTDDGTVRTALEGLKIYLLPNFDGMTLNKFFTIVMDAIGQLFYSISVAMGIMIVYGSYTNSKTNVVKSVSYIEFFDLFVAVMAGMMIVPAVYTFMGTEGMSGGPGLLFVSLPKIFNDMGVIGTFLGILFFLIVSFAAITSSVSIMEVIVSALIDRFKVARVKATIIVTSLAMLVGTVVCLGYNIFSFDLTLPNGAEGAKILDLLDYVSNNWLMPLLSIGTCVLIGWIVKPDVIVNEVSADGTPFKRKRMYIVMVRYVVPALLVFLVLQAAGIIKL